MALAAALAPHAGALSLSHYATQSRLAKGKWVKIAIPENGVIARRIRCVCSGENDERGVKKFEKKFISILFYKYKYQNQIYI